eukprot:gene15970-18989_t
MTGKDIDQNDMLSDYGLGSFFDNWQLCLVERGSQRKAGLFEVEVHFPDTPEYKGRTQRIIKVDGYMPAEQVVKFVASQMDIDKPHLFSLRMDPPSPPGMTLPPYLVEDSDYLSKHGLGSRYRKCKLKLYPKKFPKASSDRQQKSSFKLFQERKQHKKVMACKEIVDFMIDTAVHECIRASTLGVRMASLSVIGRAAMYKFLVQKEQEEFNHFKIIGQKRLADEAKDQMHSLMLLSGPSTYINLDREQEEEENKSTLQMRVPPPPPPPMLGFKNFKPKRLETSVSPSILSTTGNSKVSGGNATLANALDMNQILNMRGKLRNTILVDKKDTTKFEETNELVLRPVKLRTNAQHNIQVNMTNAKDTNELMQKFQKRNATVQSQSSDAEELGDS